MTSGFGVVYDYVFDSLKCLPMKQASTSENVISSHFSYSSLQSHPLSLSNNKTAILDFVPCRFIKFQQTNLVKKSVRMSMMLSYEGIVDILNSVVMARRSINILRLINRKRGINSNVNQAVYCNIHQVQKKCCCPKWCCHGEAVN